MPLLYADPRCTTKALPDTWRCGDAPLENIHCGTKAKPDPGPNRNTNPNPNPTPNRTLMCSLSLSLQSPLLLT